MLDDELVRVGHVGTVVVLVANPSAGQVAAARQAEAACPTRAIRVEQNDPDGVVQVPPTVRRSHEQSR